MSGLDERIYIKKCQKKRNHVIQKYRIFDYLDHDCIGNIKLNDNHIVKLKIKSKSRRHYIASESLLKLSHLLKKDIFCEINKENTVALALFTTYGKAVSTKENIRFCFSYEKLKNLDWMQVYLDKLKKYIHISTNTQSLINLPTQLKKAGKDMFNRDFHLHPLALQAWNKMKKQAQKDGIDLQVISAFRSLSYQNQLIINKINKGVELKEILKVNTLAGYSEHHSGCAIDIGSKDATILETEFENSTAYKWLTKKAKYFGFYLSYPKNNDMGIIYEPWHWCFKQMVKN